MSYFDDEISNEEFQEGIEIFPTDSTSSEGSPSQTHYYQKDSRWEKKVFNPSKHTNLGDKGCVISCIAGVLTDYGFYYTPETLVDKILSNKDLMKELMPNGDLNQEKTIFKLTNGQYSAHRFGTYGNHKENINAEQIFSAFQKNHQIILRINNDGHSIRLKDMGKNKDGTFSVIINDPGRKKGFFEAIIKMNDKKCMLKLGPDFKIKETEINYFIEVEKTNSVLQTTTKAQGGCFVKDVRSGFDTHAELMDLYQNQVKTIQSVTHANSGRKGYEVELKNGDKVLLYDGFKNNQRTDLMAIRKNDQNGELGYTNQWKKGEKIYAENTKLSEVVNSGRNVNFDDNIKQMEILKVKNSTTFSNANCVGSALGSNLAYIDKMTPEEFVVSTGKQITLGLGQNIIMNAASKAVQATKYSNVANKLPLVGPAIQGAMFLHDFVQTIDSDALSNSEKVEETLKNIASNVASIGGGLAGAAFGAEIGIAGGPLGIAFGGLIGGIAGGLFGGAINRVLHDPFELRVDFTGSSNSCDNNRTANNPNISWKNPPKATQSYILLVFLEGKRMTICSWVLTDIPQHKREIASSDYEGKKLENQLKKKEYIGPDKSEGFNKITFYLYAVKQSQSYCDNFKELLEKMIDKRIVVLAVESKNFWI